ncbi:ER membrane protein complex subunit 7-like [Argiope bruennichi]|uniref:ER membrane protein complex subunit 7 like protein n=1 Tax=Argiope bruennichi TaxID=94029 RepID=A0A8T0FC76_ARGBR|nr:ER membrane protein complex subunit 7-like [Argiope bruennichi]KAF8788511.1 ER membrane protein complex subunit 7 like protein [Argiope bruennichi]
MYYTILLICVTLAFADELDSSDNPDKYAIDGTVIPPDVITPEWLLSTKVLVNGGERLGFLRNDGSFHVSNVEPGSYVVEVINPNHIYEPARVDINSKGKFRARKLNYVQTNLVQHVPYPLKFKVRAPYKYFQVREAWRITDFLMNPMILMMVLPLLLIMILPKMMNAADPETQREMQQMQIPKYDVPELSEVMTSFFTGGKRAPSRNRAIKKRQ